MPTSTRSATFTGQARVCLFYWRSPNRFQVINPLMSPLEFDWWVEAAGCGDSVISALVEHAAQALPPVRESLGLEFDPTGRVMAFQEPMLVVRLEHIS